MKRTLFSLAFAAFVFVLNATGVLADDGSGCARPDPATSADYGDTAR